MKQLEFRVKRPDKAAAYKEQGRRYAHARKVSSEQAKAGMSEHEAKVTRLRNDVEALEAMQAGRALKPPGRR
jgi:hypothetical protein